jgi:hypothetical protein
MIYYIKKLATYPAPAATAEAQPLVDAEVVCLGHVIMHCALQRLIALLHNHKMVNRHGRSGLNPSTNGRSDSTLHQWKDSSVSAHPPMGGQSQPGHQWEDKFNSPSIERKILDQVLGWVKTTMKN